MTEPALTAGELFAWLEKTSTNWHKLLEAHPEILATPCDVAGVTSVAALLQHIVAVELRYAERLAGLPATDYAAIGYESAQAIYEVHGRAAELFQGQLEAQVDWDEKIEFVTRSMGTMRASRKTVLFHALLHSIRHYAQLATLVRQHGVKPDWPMDYLMMGVERV
jgi:uncharacterized damage-inducible protein DinB